jgi:hypothetical protein
MTDRVPPQNIEIEESVLGAMLVVEPTLTRVIDDVRLDAEDFYLDKHRVLFGCVRHLHASGRPVDELTVIEELSQHGRLEAAGGKHYVSELAAKVPAAGNARHYAEIVQQNAQLRRLLGAGQQIQGWVYDRNGDAPVALHRQAEELLADVAPAVDRDGGWLGSAASLLSQPDPGPTPFLVDRLIVEEAIAALVGSYKLGKTWLAIDTAISVASGRPLFGELEVAQGPAMVVLEESGERALHRRLGMLTRGRAIAAQELADLHYAANRRVRLDDPAWQGRLLGAAERVRPALIVLDPLVRLKGAADENSQAEMAPVLDFIRDLRDASGAAVLFTHHTGHADRGRMRGTADLEGYWESKLILSAEEGSPVATLAAEHREAESGGTLEYRRVGDDATDSMRLTVVTDDAEDSHLEELLSAVRFKPGRSTTDLSKAVGKRRSDTASRLKKLESAGTAYRSPSQITDGAGRTRTIDGWFLAPQSDSHPVPDNGTGQDQLDGEAPGRPAVPPLKGGTADHVASGSAAVGTATPDPEGEDQGTCPLPPEASSPASGRTPRAHARSEGAQ